MHFLVFREFQKQECIFLGPVECYVDLVEVARGPDKLGTACGFHGCLVGGGVGVSGFGLASPFWRRRKVHRPLRFSDHYVSRFNYAIKVTVSRFNYVSQHF